MRSSAISRPFESATMGLTLGLIMIYISAPNRSDLAGIKPLKNRAFNESATSTPFLGLIIVHKGGKQSCPF